MNNFVIRLLIRICYFTSSVLWGIMTFLQHEKLQCIKLPPIYNSLDHFRLEFSKLNACHRELDRLTLHYDNFAVFFGGMLLVLYALKQKRELAKTKKMAFWSVVFTVLLFLGIAYMALDWTENYCFLHANDPQLNVPRFDLLQYAKWVVGLFTLAALILTDILIFKNWRGILWGFFGFLLINGLVSKSFSLYKNAIPYCSEYLK